MTISRVNPGLWGIGDKLTSAQANAIDVNATYALDKRSGQSDTLESVVQNAGAGRIVPTVTIGADADTTYAVATGIQIIRVTTLTADRIYTLSTTGALEGDVITVISTASMYTTTVKTGATTLQKLGPLGDGLVASFIYNATTVAWERLRGKGPSLAIESFTANGTFVAPPWCNVVLLIGCGGGGGGGCGSASGTSSNQWHVGGGGGGGALAATMVCNVTPSSSYAVTIGAGGTGAAPLGLATAGSSTTFGSLATFKGAGYGTSCLSTRYGTSSTYIYTSSGGLSASTQLNYRNLLPSAVGFSQYDSAAIPAGITSLQLAPQQIGEGGQGASGASLAELGAPSNFGGYAGGARGVVGAFGGTGTFKPGGGGGGGAAGPFGAGGAGGNGGDGHNASPGTDGANGTSAAANTGAGGGGGGGGGADSSAGNDGGSGGNGGSGVLYVIYTVQGQ